jgi:ComF family protein
MVTTYDEAAKKLIRAYKFEEKRAAAPIIATMITETLPHFAEAPIVIFVPTATSHRRIRGFDHAELLAKEIAKQRNWHYERLLHRTSQSRQLGADREQRKVQLKNVFRAHNRKDITGKHILLIDDVVTTGATLNECAKLLYEMGAQQVDAAVFARTMEK